jgi:hypothetical protein
MGFDTMTELETISNQLNEINDKLSSVEIKVNDTNVTLAAHLAHYEECKQSCNLHHKVLFGNGDGEKGVQYKVIELCKWKSLQGKVFWAVLGIIGALIPIIVSNTIFASNTNEPTSITTNVTPKK